MHAWTNIYSIFRDKLSLHGILYSELQQNERFKLFLMSDGTTEEGQDRIADYYQVGELWEQIDKKKFL